jgi:hypothetical protein
LFRKAWTRDVDARVKELRQHVVELQATVAALRQAHRALAVREWQAHRAPLLQDLDARLNVEAIGAHVSQAIERASVCGDPTAHILVENVLPAGFYQLLADAIPPGELFTDRDPVKQDYEMDALDGAPELTRRVWRFFDQEVVAGIVAPAVLARLRDAVVAHYAETGGPAFGARAAAIPHRAFAGRIQLRRPGYHLRPHLDPKRVAITGLFYFPQPGDSEAYGTQFFRVDRSFVANGMKTYFPEEDGLACELARTVPYRANSMVAFVNSRAAHGATLPADAPLLERYAYQFYVKPDDGQLKKLLRDLPEADRAAWDALA